MQLPTVATRYIDEMARMASKIGLYITVDSLLKETGKLKHFRLSYLTRNFSIFYIFDLFCFKLQFLGVLCCSINNN